MSVPRVGAALNVGFPAPWPVRIVPAEPAAVTPNACVPAPSITPYCVGVVAVRFPAGTAPPSVSVQVVLTTVQVTRCPVVGTTVKPLMVFVPVIVAGEPHTV